MSKSEFATRVSAEDNATSAGSTRPTPAPVTIGLLDAPLRTELVVTSVGAEHEAPLAREGFGIGARIEIERKVGFGGPAIVRVGSARVAIARSVLATVAVAFAPAAESR